jgi:hypothetical protein
LWFGPMSLNIHENLVIPLPPVLGLISLIVGIAMIMSAPRYIAAPPPY